MATVCTRFSVNARLLSTTMLMLLLAALATGCGSSGGGGDDDGNNPGPADLRLSRDFRAITGVSMGGYGAMNLGTKHSDLFGTIGSLGGPVDMTLLIAQGIDDNLEVKPQTGVPRDVGSDFTFDHLAPYPDRDTRNEMLQDLVMSFGNTYLHNPDPARQFLASDSEPARLMRDDQFDNFVTPADPRGFLNGGDTNENGVREVTEAPTTPVDAILLAGGTLDAIAGPVDGTVVGGRETVDLDGDGIFDVGDGVVVNLSEPFSDDGDHVYEPDAGETFEDVGLDGVAGTGDFGEGNGQFDYDPDRAHWLAEDPLTRLAGRPSADIATQRIYMDVGEQDEFGFADHYRNFVAMLQAKGLTVEIANGFSAVCAAVPDLDDQFLLIEYPGGHIGVEDVDNDDLFSGDVCGPVLVWQRILALLGYLDSSFPDGVRGPGDIDPGDLDDIDSIDDLDDIDLPGIDLTGDIVFADITSPALAVDGGDAPTRQVLVYRPPAFFNNPDDTFPIAYFLGGYGQEPEDFERMRELLDFLIVTGQVQNMFFAFLPGAGGRQGSFYVNQVVPQSQVPGLTEVTSGRYEDSIMQDLIPAVEREVLGNRVRRRDG